MTDMRTTTRRALTEAIPEIKIGPEPDESCAHCPHNWGDHIFGSKSPLQGGLWWCNDDDCDCPGGTWNIPQLEQRNN